MTTANISAVVELLKQVYVPWPLKKNEYSLRLCTAHILRVTRQLSSFAQMTRERPRTILVRLIRRFSSYLAVIPDYRRFNSLCKRYAFVVVYVSVCLNDKVVKLRSFEKSREGFITVSLAFDETSTISSICHLSPLAFIVHIRKNWLLKQNQFTTVCS